MSVSTAFPPGRPGKTFDPAQAASIGLWLFMAVATSLFGLFLAAYVMRLDGADGFPLAMPWQFWLSTGLLVAGSVVLHAATVAARSGADATVAWRLGGICAAAFVLVQLWGWQALAANQVLPGGNPASSFLYVLTALHGLHVIGGIGAWFQASAKGAAATGSGGAWRIALCARYWHFLLALWLLLFAVLGLMTPDIVRAICGTLGAAGAAAVQ